MSDELLDQFLIEAPELVAQASEDLLALEQTPDDRGRLDSAFRAIHTLKGSVALFGFERMTAMLHAAEDLLGAVRDGSHAADEETLGVLLDAVTRSEAWLADIERGGAPLGDDGGLAERIRVLMDEPGSLSAAPVDEPQPDWVAPLLAGIDAAASPRTAVRYRPDPGCYFAGDDPLAIARRTPGLLVLRISLREAPGPPEAYNPYACNLVIDVVSSEAPQSVRAVFRFVPDQVEVVELGDGRAAPAALAEGSAPAAAARSLRVDAARIDELSSLVDDLVVAKTALAELDGAAHAGLEPAKVVEGLAARRAEIDRLVQRLHGAVVGLRLAPLTPTLRRLPRLVRAAAGELGKQVDLVISDEGALADKSVVEGLFDPLVHLLRNAIDHGIEPPAERLAAGKPAQGRLDLRVSRSGDLLSVVVADDGRGIDPARIRAAARRSRLMSDTALDALADAEVAELIFRPGFSTAEAVSSVSGRGVGMDAARASLARLGGAVSVASELGRGTTVTIALPVNVVMTRLLVVESNREVYGVPMSKVIETARIAAVDATPIRAGRAVVLRDAPTPVFDLGELLGGPPPDWAGSDFNALVVKSGHGPIAVRIDRLRPSLDTVMRPLRGLLAGMPGVVGSTLLGDGRVMMVLDPAELVG